MTLKKTRAAVPRLGCFSAKKIGKNTKKIIHNPAHTTADKVCAIAAVGPIAVSLSAKVGFAEVAAGADADYELDQQIRRSNTSSKSR